MFRKISEGAKPEVFVRGFIEQLRHEHRTHQQDVIRAVLWIVEAYAKEDHDLRNEEAVHRCVQLAQVIEEEGPLPRL